jgi:O-antigen/teichoic acid export membrane protein
MLVASLPYYLNTFAFTAYGKLDVSLLEFMGNTREVGWYGAASAAAGLTLLVTPLIGWVLSPMFARAASRSLAELDEQIRRSLELIMSVAIPAALLISLGADFWIQVIFGSAFAPAASALRVLALMFVLTYVAMIYANALVMLERPWILTSISIAGLVVNVTLNLFLIRYSMDRFGLGGGGTGCALAMLGTEIFVTGSMVAFLGRRAFDRRGTIAIAKSLAACAVVWVIHRSLASIGPLRLIVDVAVYLLLVLSTGALRLRDMVSLARDALRRRA